MIRIRKTFYFKILTTVLVFLFLYRTDGWVLTAQDIQDLNPDKQFKKAKACYANGYYEEAKKILSRLESIYKDIPGRTTDLERKYGQALLLLGACLEKLNKDEKTVSGAYMLAREKLGNTFTFSDLDLCSLEIYRKVFNIKMNPMDQEKTIEKEIPPIRKKKKFPWLWVAGAVVVTAAVILLLSKKPKRTLTVSVGEGVDGSPASGTTTYKNGAVVSYNYSVKNGYSGLVVRLDGTEVATSGTIKMDKNHTLTASASKTYSLTVTKGDGVAGIPDSGTFSYGDGETFNYNYALQSGYTDLVVKLDDLEVPSSGTVNMNQNHTLDAAAKKLYTLTVTKGEGVVGLPDSGSFTYKEGDSVFYNYSLQNGYSSLEVKLDGNPATGSGFITMDKDHILMASASIGI